jgi:hypothetical protein
MNRWQIICPVIALVVFVFVLGILHERSEHRGFTLERTHQIGRELIASTNSPNLDNCNPEMRKWLSEFLRTPTEVFKVLIGDEPRPIGDGTACSRLFLKNNAGGLLGIRLGPEPDSLRFRVLGYWTVTNQIQMAK